jgi:hypothetical protein
MLKRDRHCDLHIISQAYKIGAKTLGGLGDFEPPLARPQVVVFAEVNYYHPSQTYPLETTINIFAHQ